MLYAQQVLDAELDESSDRAAYLANLASTYCSLPVFSHSGQFSDIEAAIQYQQQAIVKRSIGYKSPAEYLSDLEIYSGFRYDKSRTTADLDQYVQFQLQVLDEASQRGRIRHHSWFCMDCEKLHPLLRFPHQRFKGSNFRFIDECLALDYPGTANREEPTQSYQCELGAVSARCGKVHFNSMPHGMIAPYIRTYLLPHLKYVSQAPQSPQTLPTLTW
jgi:hypothetical protein